MLVFYSTRNPVKFSGDFKSINVRGNMEDCIFCKIVDGQIPSNAVYQDEKVFAFRDINPQAPTHILIIPKKHIPTINDLKGDKSGIISDLFQTALKLAVDEGIDQEGYRTVFNCNANGEQEVDHIHLHLLGGRKMTWPPG